MLMCHGMRHGGDLPRNIPWYFDKTKSGDIVVDQGIHILDLFNWAIGSPPSKAMGSGGTNLFVNDREQTRFALDVGGVAEFYPNHHVVLRVDASDVIIPFGNNVVGQGLFAQRLGTTHNFQFTLGVGVRF